MKEHHGHWARRNGERSNLRADPGYFEKACEGSEQPPSKMPDNPIDPWSWDRKGTGRYGRS